MADKVRRDSQKLHCNLITFFSNKQIFDDESFEEENSIDKIKPQFVIETFLDSQSSVRYQAKMIKYYCLFILSLGLRFSL